MVAFNLALCMLIATATRKSSWAPVAVSTLRLAGIQLAFVALLILSMVSFGSSQISGFQSEKMRIVSVVQLNLGAKFDHTGQKPDAREIWRQCKMAAQSCPRGLIVFSESILPEDALQVAGLRQEIQSFAREHGSDLIMGVWERTKDGQTYNSVISFPASERFRSQIYRKRYLMPVGEFEPFIMRFLGEGARRTLHFSLMPDIQRGVEPTSLPTASGAIGVLVCAENSQPALCAQSVGSDTNLIVNLGTLTWFEGSRLGDLSKASAIFRAVENRRSIVYASDTGPSFIVDPTGRILASSKWSEPAIIQAMVPLNNEVSATTSWFCRICGTQR